MCESRYLVFAGQDQYPAGGWNDIRAIDMTLSGAIDFKHQLKDQKKYDWYQIVEYYFSQSGSIHHKYIDNGRF